MNTDQADDKNSSLSRPDEMVALFTYRGSMTRTDKDVDLETLLQTRQSL